MFTENCWLFCQSVKNKKTQKGLALLFLKSEFIMNWWKKSVENRTVQVMYVCVFCWNKTSVSYQPSIWRTARNSLREKLPSHISHIYNAILRGSALCSSAIISSASSERSPGSPDVAGTNVSGTPVSVTTLTGGGCTWMQIGPLKALMSKMLHLKISPLAILWRFLFGMVSETVTLSRVGQVTSKLGDQKVTLNYLALEFLEMPFLEGIKSTFIWGKAFKRLLRPLSVVGVYPHS